MSASAAARLAKDAELASVVPDREVRITAQTLPPGNDRVDADVSSALTGNGWGAMDAVIDTGIDVKHRDLNVVGGANCVPSGTSPNDLNKHGTHVAGIAAAKDNGVGVVGVAPGVRL